MSYAFDFTLSYIHSSPYVTIGTKDLVKWATEKPY